MYFYLKKCVGKDKMLFFMLINIKIWKGALSCRLGFLLNCRKGLSLMRRWALALRCCSIAARAITLCSRSSREGFSFLLPEQKKRNKENSPSALFGLLRQVFPLNKKNSLTLKQLFVFNAPTLTSASRPKSEAGPFRFFSQHRFARWGVMFSFFCFVCWGECL